MLSPSEIARHNSAMASLLCAVTPVRRTPVDVVQSDAKRDSFSQGICSTGTNFSRLWRGLEQTAFKCKARLIGRPRHALREKTIPSGMRRD